MVLPVVVVPLLVVAPGAVEPELLPFCDRKYMNAITAAPISQTIAGIPRNFFCMKPPPLPPGSGDISLIVAPGK